MRNTRISFFPCTLYRNTVALTLSYNETRWWEIKEKPILALFTLNCVCGPWCYVPLSIFPIYTVRVGMFVDPLVYLYRISLSASGIPSCLSLSLYWKLLGKLLKSHLFSQFWGSVDWSHYWLHGMSWKKELQTLSKSSPEHGMPDTSHDSDLFFNPF